MKDYRRNKISDTIFTDPFPDVKNNEDLEKLKHNAPFSQYDESYVTSGAIQERRAYFDQLWIKYRAYADEHFLKQVKIMFHNRTWEMYIGNVLLESKVSFASGNKGADFIVKNNIHLECVACTLGKNIPQLKITKKGGSFDVPNKPLETRITTTLDTKKKQYYEWLQKGTIKDTNPYVLAINTKFRGYADYPNIPRLIKVLFGVGDLTLSFSQDGKKSDAFFKYEETLQNRNSASVRKHIFNDPDYSFISAVIFSQIDVLNTSDKKIGQDLQIVYNPAAKNKFKKGDFDFIQEYVLQLSYEVEIF